MRDSARVRFGRGRGRIVSSVQWTTSTLAVSSMQCSSGGALVAGAEHQLQLVAWSFVPVRTQRREWRRRPAGAMGHEECFGGWMGVRIWLMAAVQAQRFPRRSGRRRRRAAVGAGGLSTRERKGGQTGELFAPARVRMDLVGAAPRCLERSPSLVINFFRVFSLVQRAPTQRRLQQCSVGQKEANMLARCCSLIPA
jgi:hypothetical protein